MNLNPIPFFGDMVRGAFQGAVKYYKAAFSEQPPKEEINFIAISRFSKDPDAMIKSDSAGNLFYAHEYVTRGYFKGSTLEDTAKVITDTVENIFNTHSIKGELTSDRNKQAELWDKMIRNYKETVELKQGLLNIIEVYSKRYQDLPEKQEELTRIWELLPKIDNEIHFLLQELTKMQKLSPPPHRSIPTTEEIIKNLEAEIGEMDSLSEHLSEAGKYSAEQLENNFTAITHFTPEFKARIKADTSGNLYFYTDSKVSRSYGCMLGTPFEGVVDVMKTTVKQMMESYESKLHQASEKIKTSGDQDKELIMDQLSDDLRSAIKLKIGVENILSVYGMRYPESEGSKEKALNSLRQLSCDMESSLEGLSYAIAEIGKREKVPVAIPSMESIKKELEDQTAARSSLDAFCKVYNPKISAEKAKSMILEGKQLHQGISSGKIVKPSDGTEEKEHQLACLCWYLTGLCLKKNQGFSDGAFMIEDTNDRLYAFLKLAAGTESPNRDSSHFISRSPTTRRIPLWGETSRQFGVDVTNGELPTGKRHIVFEKIPSIEGAEPQNLLFFKIESFSPFLTTGYGKDFLIHGFELFESKYRSYTNPTGHEEPGMRKEKLPSTVDRQLKTVLLQLNGRNLKNKEFCDMKKVAENSKKYGLAYINRFIKALEEEELPPEINFSGIRYELDQYDNLDLRTGREVILLNDDF